MCHTFNGESLSTIWKPSKVVTAFNNVFNTDNDHNSEYFGGAGSVQGEFKRVSNKYKLEILALRVFLGADAQQFGTRLASVRVPLTMCHTLN